MRYLEKLRSFFRRPTIFLIDRGANPIMTETKHGLVIQVNPGRRAEIYRDGGKKITLRQRKPKPLKRK